MSRGDGERQRLEAVYEGYSASRRRAKAWSATNAGNAAMRDEVTEAILAEIRKPTGLAAPIADIGCGSGWWLDRLAAAGVAEDQLYGIDLLTDRVEAARRRLPRAGLVAGDARRLPWSDASFAAVTILTALSSMPTATAQSRTLAEAVRVLRPGGLLFVWEPRVANPFNPATTLVRRRTLERVLGSAFETQPVTLLPPLARRVGRVRGAYHLLVRIRPLRTHRLVRFDKP